MEKFHISATSHWPNYLPEYVAKDLGFFEEVGLDFSREAPDEWTHVLDHHASGRAQAVLGGLWVPAMYHGRGREYVAFAQLNATNPKVLVARTPDPDFQLSDLVGRLVLAPGAGGTAPYMHTAGVIAAAGVDVSSISFLRDLGGGTFAELFRGGLGDYLVTDVVNGQIAEAQGWGHVVYRHWQVGAMPNSVYYAHRDQIGDDSDSPYWRFTAAIQRAMDWLRDHDAEEVRGLLAREWPKVDTDVLVGAVNVLRGTGVWENVLVGRDGYAEWMGILKECDLIADVPAYATLVATAPGEAALASSSAGALAGLRA
ncbi:ABC transporter substrate-binding protein [Microbacterium sp. NPDC057659]|uniref:ABC transporter substrate-binding protein n=1 Tax=Microbacterium sp. NPDC057659 TaxID=3346198 RepID=UPI0036735A93